VFDDRPEALLYLNRSSPMVRAGYRAAYMDLLDEEERAHVQVDLDAALARRR